ncbi:actin-7-related [Anaeramoeba ignava]|uniref:Actin-7-related n=1 Tax=Anaeramoeba ignava TaxID=1746090 RepID=A0A9Q0R8N2_ANAIG|nr:actin-7-related [Anaeramoeba ignava]
MSEEIKPIVIDNGSSLTKAGFAGEESPKSVFPTIVGKKRYLDIIRVGMGEKNYYIGDEANGNRGYLELEFPIEKGIIQNMDYMEKIWHHIFYNELRVSPEQYPVLLTQVPFNPKNQRELTTQIMFETFNVPSFYMANQGILPLYSTGKTTGISVNIGDGVSFTYPVYNSHSLSHCMIKSSFAGKDITNFLIRLLTERGYFFETTPEFQIVNELKEKLCYVSLDFDKELEISNQNDSLILKNFELPNGKILTIGNQLFRCPEALFQPKLIGKEQKGIHQMIFDSIMKCDIHTRKDLFQNIILVGGSTFFPGFLERLQNEMNKLVPPSMKIQFIVPSERKYSVWIGGSIFASLSSFQKKVILKEEYEEYGPGIIHEKCF